MRSIETLQDLSEVISDVTNRIVEVAATKSTSDTEYVNHNHVADLISWDDYQQYFGFIAHELRDRPEVAVLNTDDMEYPLEFDVKCDPVWCKGDDSRKLIHGPSMAHLAEIGRRVVKHAATEDMLAQFGAGDFGITQADIDHIKSLDDSNEYEEQGLIPPLSSLPVTTYSYEDLLCRTAQDKTFGKEPTVRWCVNHFGQVIDEAFLKKHPDLKERFETIFESLTVKEGACRSGVVIHGEGAVMLTYPVDPRTFEAAGKEDDNVYHAQTRMMTSQLSSVLSVFNVNISCGYNTFMNPYVDSPRSNVDEIVVILPAFASLSEQQRFITEFEKNLGELSVALDIDKIETYYNSFYANAKALTAHPSTSQYQFLSGNEDRMALEACGWMCQSYGYSGSSLIITQTNAKEFIDQAMKASSMSAYLDLTTPIKLKTKGHDNPITTGSFMLPKGELLKFLPEVGYTDPQLSLPDFLECYSWEVARELQDLHLENRKQLPLESQIQAARQGREDRGPSDKGTVRDERDRS